MGMDVLAGQLFKIAVMVLLGYLLKKRGIITGEMQSGLSTLLLTCVMPLDILAAGNNPFDAALARGLLVSAVAGAVYYALLIGCTSLLAKRLSMPEKKRGLLVALVAFANVGFVGYPLIKGLFGNEGYMYAVVHNFVFQIFIATVGVWLMDRTAKISPRKLLLSPLIIAPVVAVGVFLSPWQWPVLLGEIFAQVGGMMVPLSMFIIGASLADIPLRSLWSDKWGYLVCALRLVVTPLVTLGLLLLFGITGVVGATLVVLSGLCSGTLCVIFAQRYGQDVEFATRAVMQTMVLMVPVLPLLFLLVNRLMLA